MSLYKLSYNFVFSYLIPSEQKQYLQKEAWRFKRILKFWRRYLYMFFTKQLKLELNNIPHTSRNILWINTTAPSLGDSLMDLAGRVLLENFNVDLYTSSKNSILYKYDLVFKNIFDEMNMNFDKNYDLIIVDSFSPRSMKIKNKYFSQVPFVGMYGFINGFEIHRTYYSFFRLASLLDVKIDKSICDLSMAIPNNCVVSDLPDKFITIVVGAEWDFRRYKDWDKIIEILNSEYSIVLIGSSNGLDESKNLENFFGVINYVDKLTLHQTAFVISKSFAQLCADGGLWHFACALRIPSVVLFADCHLYLGDKHYLRNTEAQKCIALYSDKTVSNIEPSVIIESFYKLKEKL